MLCDHPGCTRSHCFVNYAADPLKLEVQKRVIAAIIKICEEDNDDFLNAMDVLRAYSALSKTDLEQITPEQFETVLAAEEFVVSFVKAGLLPGKEGANATKSVL